MTGIPLFHSTRAYRVQQCLFLLALACAFIVRSDHQRDKLLFLRKSSGVTEPLLVVTQKKSYVVVSTGCEIINDKDLINEILKSSDESNIRTLSEEEMDNIFGDCKEFRLKRRREIDRELSSVIETDDVNDTPRKLSPSTSYANKRTQNRYAHRKLLCLPCMTKEKHYTGPPIIFPGTKWCGPGNIAENYDDLGLHYRTDRCCRTHDHCDDKLEPGETRHNLTNHSIFVRLNCECDNDLYYCLNRVNSVTSNTIGQIYFNIMKRKCYTKDYPNTSKCIKYKKIFLKTKCVEYEKDMTAKPIYQWVPAKVYKKIPFLGSLKAISPL